MHMDMMMKRLIRLYVADAEEKEFLIKNEKELFAVCDLLAEDAVKREFAKAVRRFLNTNVKDAAIRQGVFAETMRLLMENRLLKLRISGIFAAYILEKEDVMNADEVWKALNENIETLTQKDEMEEFMFLGLRMTDGVSKSDFKKIFNCDIEAVYGNVIEKLVNQNQIKEAGDLITLTDKGIDISNIVLANFLL